MVTLGKEDMQTTKEGFVKIFEYYQNQGLTIQEAYYRTVAYVEYLGLTPNYATLESFRSTALYAKKVKK